MVNSSKRVKHLVGVASAVGARAWNQERNTEQRKAAKTIAEKTKQKFTMPGKPTGALKDEMQKIREQCFVEVYVTDTKDGPGHISASMIKEALDGEAEVLSHTSFMPVAGGGIVNAPLLGTIPVPAEVFPDIRDEDVTQADRIIRIPVTEEGLRRGIDKQERLEESIRSGDSLYSVTGSANELTVGIAALIHGYRLSEAVVKKHEEETGYIPFTDDFGFLISYCQVSMRLLVAHNCTSAGQRVVEKATGCLLEEKSVLPKSLGEAILREVPGAKVVEQSKVLPRVTEEDGLGEDHADREAPDM